MLRRVELRDARGVTPLVLAAGPHLALLLGGRAQALRAIAACVRADRTMFGNRYGLLDDEADEVRGAVFAFPGRQWGSLRLGTGVVLARAAGVARGLDLVRRGRILDRLHPSVPEDALYVSALAVSSGYRRLGIGRALMERVVAGGGRLGLGVCLDVDLDNDPARTLYEKLGFRTVDERKAEPDEVSLINTPGFARMRIEA